MTILLAEFLLARIEEEESAATAATLGPWRWDIDGDLVTVHELPLPGGRDQLPGSVLWADGYDSNDPTIVGRPTDREHITRWDPTRVLAQCRARRSVVQLLAPLAVDCGSCVGCPPCHTLRLLALPYGDHSEFEAGWRPAPEERHRA